MTNVRTLLFMLLALAENNAREALWKALKARFPSARLPTIVYLDSKEE